MNLSWLEPYLGVAGWHAARFAFLALGMWLTSSFPLVLVLRKAGFSGAGFKLWLSALSGPVLLIAGLSFFWGERALDWHITEAIAIVMASCFYSCLWFLALVPWPVRKRATSALQK